MAIPAFHSARTRVTSYYCACTPVASNENDTQIQRFGYPFSLSGSFLKLGSNTQRPTPNGEEEDRTHKTMNYELDEKLLEISASGIRLVEDMAKTKAAKQDCRTRKPA